MSIANRLGMSLTASLVLLAAVSVAPAQYSGGSGTADDPYSITTAAGLITLGHTPDDYDKHFVLTADIDLDPDLPGRQIFRRAVIAWETEPNDVKSLFQGTAFRGVFDGKGHTIANLTIEGAGYLGLFGRLDVGGEVRNLGLENVRIAAATGRAGGLAGESAGTIIACHASVQIQGQDGVFCLGGLVGDDDGGFVIDCYSHGAIYSASQSFDLGGLVGENEGTITGSHSTTLVTASESDNVGGLAGQNRATITHCYASGPVQSLTGKFRQGHIGGLVGDHTLGKITFCYSTGTVTGSYVVGGLVGNSGATIANCWSTSRVVGPYHAMWLGGLVGSNGGCSLGIINNCWSAGAVSGSEIVGGLVGINHGMVSQCYSRGPVNCPHIAGGLVGYNWENSVAACFWDVEASGVSNMCGAENDEDSGCDDAFGRTTAEMHTAGTFLEAGWDFVNEAENGTEEIWWILEAQSYPRLSWEDHAVPLHPCDGATDVLPLLLLSWSPGGRAVEHDIYFGQDEEAVAAATTTSADLYRGRQPRQTTTYDPGPLQGGETYYWRIDVVDETDPNSPWQGELWSFSTADYLVASVVDDFESYTDDQEAGQAIWQTWIDGWIYISDPNDPNDPPSYLGNGSGAMVGNWVPPFAEQKIVHGGLQSMPIDYNNVGEPYYSEVDRTWEMPQDWTADGAEALTLYVRGEMDNDPQPLYVAVEDGAGQLAIATHPDANAVRTTAWQKWHIALIDLEAAAVNLTAVRKMSIGLGDHDNPQPGGTGRIYVDDIRLTNSMP